MNDSGLPKAFYLGNSVQEFEVKAVLGIDESEDVDINDLGDRFNAATDKNEGLNIVYMGDGYFTVVNA